jgi:hypothetical protein
VRTYKSRDRGNLIEQRNQNSLTHLLKDEELTLAQKQFLVQSRNPFLHIFGEKLVVKGEQDYETYINKLYLGESK